MPQKDKFTTKSSRSSTSETGVFSLVQYVKGVGPRLGAIFSSRGIETVRDLLTFFPRGYEDRTQLKPVSDLTEGTKASVAVRVLSARKISMRGGRSILEARTSDDAGTLSLKWFHAPRGLESRLIAGTPIIVTGTPKLYLGRYEMIHPEISWGKSADSQSDTELNVGRVVPVYTELDGIPSRTFRKVLWEAIQKFGLQFPEDLPAPCVQKHGLPTAIESIREIHFPSKEEEIPSLVEFATPWHARFIYEEFFKFEFFVLQRRLRMQREQARPIGQAGGRKASADLEAQLPFHLTGGQKAALGEILDDLEKDHPMNRLVQGDVGSGKTVVALLTAAAALAEGAQAALMAPTEILAEQHFKNTEKLFAGKIRSALLTGKTPESERRILLERLKKGEPLLLIGTHALLEDPVEFSELAVVLIDEQHRFGVEQRRTLRKKGGDKIPHALLLTATPIPRTLALTAYGDLTVTTIRELPPGRSPIHTEVVLGNQRIRTYESIRAQLKAGHQAYFIYPLIQDSEAEGFTSLRSAMTEAETLSRDVFSEFKVGLLHGQLRPDEKSEIMNQFKRGELHVLVSTTVVEVGVDVPNATVMVIEHAERFGLSQLHQLRGRVGRGSAQSYCFLLSHPRVGEQTAERLKVLETSQDGFEIAEADLRIRGPGEFLGTRQSGSLPFKMADLVRDRDWLIKAREDAIDLLKTDPNLDQPQNRPLRDFLVREGRLQMEFLKTS
ncbi:MAG: ATP-dependent DNA helicase RecG [Oligoflexia bacterium]